MLVAEAKVSIMVVPVALAVEIVAVLALVVVLMMLCCFGNWPFWPRLLLASQQLARQPTLNPQQN